MSITSVAIPVAVGLTLKPVAPVNKQAYAAAGGRGKKKASKWPSFGGY
jgi:hypothetical protein